MLGAALLLFPSGFLCVFSSFRAFFGSFLALDAGRRAALFSVGLLVCVFVCVFSSIRVVVIVVVVVVVVWLLCGVVVFLVFFMKAILSFLDFWTIFCCFLFFFSFVL